MIRGCIRLRLTLGIAVGMSTVIVISLERGIDSAVESVSHKSQVRRWLVSGDVVTGDAAGRIVGCRR